MDPQTPGQYAAAISASRDTLVGLAATCTDAEWASCPLGDADPRPAGVIVDHVAHAYDYFAALVRAILAGEVVEIRPALIDDLNRRHAVRAASITREDVIAHLTTAGDALVDLVGSLVPGDLDLQDGRVRRLAGVAIRHAESHRCEIEAGPVPFDDASGM